MRSKFLNELDAFYSSMEKILDDSTGCPWMLAQTHQTFMPYLIEEAYEAQDALAKGSSQEFCDELGDVFLQIILHAHLASKSGAFTFYDIIHGIHRKMVRRHPHIFETFEKLTPREVKLQWEILKNKERLEKGLDTSKESYFHSCKKSHPASVQSLKIGERAKTLGFDWPDAQSTFQQLASEWKELEEISQKDNFQPTSKTLDELGDLYFSLSQYCRHLGYTPEAVAQHGNDKFLNRFDLVEEIALRHGHHVKDLDPRSLEKLWGQAKKEESI